MYGYIRPLKGELKVKQYEQFSAVYCGLCHTLKKRYGPFARMTVNYDFTFLTMLLADEDYEPSYIHKKCPASPFRKKCCCNIDMNSSIAADYSIILAYWKLIDSLEDEKFLKRLYIGPLSILMRGKYKKAASGHRAFADEIEKRLSELKVLEQSKDTTLDQAADKFALILEAASQEIKDEKRRLITGKMLYHIGRLIYILDAADDLREDFKARRFNPLLQRLSISGGELDDKNKQLIKDTLHHSANIAAVDFELLSTTAYTDIISNILYLGIPNAIELVLNGRWKHVKERPKVK